MSIVHKMINEEEGEGRVKKSKRNAKNIVVSQIINLISGMALRLIIVHSFGKELLGLNGLLTEVIALLSLAEMQVGTAITYNLYEPLKTGDNYRVSQLMKLFKKFYYIIAIVVLVIGALLTPIIPGIVKGLSYSTKYVLLVYWLFVVRAAVTYLYSYKVSLISADQRSYIPSKVNRLYTIATTILAFFLLMIAHNYILYLIIDIILLVASNIINTHFVNILYPYINSKVEDLNKGEIHQIFKNVKYLFVSSLSARITSSTDSILISCLVDTIQAGVYSNYAVLFRSIANFPSKIAASITGSIGNTMVSESNEKCDEILRKLTFLFYGMAFFCGVGLTSIVNPTVCLLFGSDYLLNDWVVFAASLNFLLCIIREPLYKVLNTSGLFKEDMYISITEIIVNLIISLIVGYYYGIVGILLGTSCTYLIKLYLGSKIVYKDRLKLNSKKYHFEISKMIIVYIFTSVMSLFTSEYVLKLLGISYAEQSVLSIIICGCIALAYIIVVLPLCYRNTDEYKYSKKLILGGLNHVKR